MSPCMEYAGAHQSGGYAHNGKGLIHRQVWEAANGPIPAGLVVNHLCRNKGCVELDHLEVVTPSRNVLHGFGWDAETCKRGHEGQRLHTSAGKSYCRLCARASEARSRARKKALT